MNLHRLRIAAFLPAILMLALPALAKVQPFPAGFRTQDIETNGATIHTRIGGQGPAVLLLHGLRIPATCVKSVVINGALPLPELARRRLRLGDVCLTPAAG